MKKKTALFLIVTLLIAMTFVACKTEKAIITCNNCFAEVAENSQYCSNCGTQLVESIGTTAAATIGTTIPTESTPDATEDDAPDNIQSTTENTTADTQNNTHGVTNSTTNNTSEGTNPPATTTPSTADTLPSEATDYTAIINTHSGRWYLQGYSDIYIDVARLGDDEAMHIEARGISLPFDDATSDSYVIYPSLINGYEVGRHGIDIPFSAWDEWLTKTQISLNNTSITLGNRIFVRNPGTKDKYTGTFCKEALGTWYFDKNTDIQIEIEIIGRNEENGDIYGISTQCLDLTTLQYTKNDHRTITAAKRSDWEDLGISVFNGKLTISNAHGTKTFYREPTYTDSPSVTEPPATNPPKNEPPITEPPATNPPVTEPPTTESPAVEQLSDVLIISGTYVISNQTIDTDVYITSTGVATFSNVIINGNIYCYGQLKCSGCTANNVYAYAYGSMMSCPSFDGTHGKVSGGIDCNKLSILDDSLDYAFNKWGKK